VVNGDSVSTPLELAAGVPHRFRFVNIGPAQRVIFAVRRDSTILTWRPLAKDGADLPPRSAVVGPAHYGVAVGETFDAEFTPPGPGEYVLTMGPLAKQMGYTLRLIVR
jgi:hypothetical protein